MLTNPFFLSSSSVTVTNSLSVFAESRYALYSSENSKILFFFDLYFLKNICSRKMEVDSVRTKITLACTDCKQRNYNTTKDKKNHPDRMETKKYCRFCKAHTLHKETK